MPGVPLTVTHMYMLASGQARRSLAAQRPAGALDLATLWQPNATRHASRCAAGQSSGP